MYVTAYWSRIKGYLPALLTRQEAYFELHMAQQVVDDFYAIKDIYAGLAKPYELAAEVFHIYRQHKDTLHIVEQAEEAEVSSRKLELLKVKARRLAAEEKEAYEEVYKTGGRSSDGAGGGWQTAAGGSAGRCPS